MRYRSHFLFPVLVMVLVSLAATVGLLLWLTSLQNEMEDGHERDRVEAAITARQDAIGATTKVFSVWDDAVLHLVSSLDGDWVDSEIGRYTSSQFGIETTFVIDVSGRSVYGFVDGKRSFAEAGRLLGNGYIAAARSVVRAPPSLTNQVTGLSQSPRGPLIFSISRIRPHSSLAEPFESPRRYLVLSKLIDRKVLNEIAKSADIPTLSLIGRQTSDEGRLSVNLDRHASLALVWKPIRSGTILRRKAIPWLVLVVLLLLGMAAEVLFRARKGTRELVASEKKARYLASRDHLTGLPNRRAFTDALIDLTRRGVDYTMVYMDLDGFKEVNDSFGHAVGDTLLHRTGQRLQRLMPAEAVLARLGGDEFAITLERAVSREELNGLAAQLVDAVRQPHEFGGEPTIVGVSIGIAASDRCEYEEIIHRADTAMYAAKAEGRDGWMFYDASMEEGRGDRKRLEHDLRHAIAAGEISLVFQPIVRVSDKQTVAVEALARWAHPTRGSISPDVFIPIAEESGLIVELGQHILEMACSAARDWPFDLAVNLSPAQFWDRALADNVLATLERCEFPPERLELEITETYLLRRPEAAEKIISQLRRNGIQIALDDFGTGYASIGYLRRFELDRVKIDRSLVERVAFDPAAADVMLAIIALCKALNLRILAEGVETGQQACILETAGCTYFQGWHYGFPVTAEEVDASVRGSAQAIAF